MGRAFLFFLSLFTVVILIAPIQSRNKKYKSVKDTSELPKGVWSGAEATGPEYTVSFCENNKYYRTAEMIEGKPVQFRMWRDKFGLEISVNDAKTNKWVGLTLLYKKPKQKLYFWGDNAESELTMEEAVPMKQISADCSIPK